MARTDKEKPAKAPPERKRVQRQSKIYGVPIPLMRVPPALIAQRPFMQAHGDAIAADLRLEDLGFPVLNHRDGIYWVLDGQHRIYALKQNGLGDSQLDCEVYDGLTDAEMAAIFLGRDARRAIAPFEKFHIHCTAEHARELDIRRSVEAQGLKIGRNRESKTIMAVTALGKVYDRAGARVLEQALRALRDGFIDEPAAFDGNLIQGVGLLFQRFNGKTNEQRLAQKLSALPHGITQIMRRAEAQRDRTGNQKAQCIAAVLVELYNQGAGPRAADRLPPWWKVNGRE